MSAKIPVKGGLFDRWSEGDPLTRKRVKVRRDLPTLLSLSARSLAMEQYRKLAVRVEERMKASGKESFVLTISSPDEGVGKTLTSMNLALTLASRKNGGVLLADGDLWRPKLHNLLTTVPGSGLRDVLKGPQTVGDAVVSVEETGLQLITAGTEGLAEEWMYGPRLEQAIDEMRTICPVVVIDSSPLPLVAVTQSLANYSDGVLLVVGAKKSKKQQIEEALSMLGPDKVMGMVLNRVHESKLNRYYYEFKE
jgi:Mrp family chromosome partitioning ATPase